MVEAAYSLQHRFLVGAEEAGRRGTGAAWPDSLIPLFWCEWMPHGPSRSQTAMYTLPYDQSASTRASWGLGPPPPNAVLYSWSGQRPRRR
jgi:hypothetical protein